MSEISHHQGERLMSHLNYHTQGKGRPKKEGGVYTDVYTQKKKVLLRDGDGSPDCPIDVLKAQRIITDEESMAIKLYRSIWSSAYGSPIGYCGSIWSGILGGSGPRSGDQNEEYYQNKKKKIIKKYHELDEYVLNCSKEGRKCIRDLAQGVLPSYLRSVIWAASKNFKYVTRIEAIDEAISDLGVEDIKPKELAKAVKKLKDSGTLKKPISYYASKRKLVDDLITEKRNLDKKLSAITTDKEPSFDIYARDQFRLSLRCLIRYFNSSS